MKKVVLILMVLVLAFPVFATQQEGTGSATGTSAEASLLATFTMDSETISDSITVGFTSDTLSDGFAYNTTLTDTALKSVTLTDATSSGVASSTGTINAYCQIISTTALTVSLEIRSPLKGDTETNKLGWTVKGDGGNTAALTDEAGSEAKSSFKFHDHTPATSTSSASYEPITIETDNYLGKPTDTYSGYIYVVVSAEQVGEI